MIISAFLYLIILPLTLFYVYHRAVNRRKYELGSTFPGPFSLPLIGSAHLLFTRRPEDVLKFFYESRRRYGGIMRVWVGLKLAFLVSDARMSEVVLSNSTKYLAKNDLYNFLVPWLGDGLLLSRCKKWHSRRKILTPAFHFTILEQFVDIFDKQGRVMIDRLNDAANNGNVFDISKYVTLMALDIVCGKCGISHIYFWNRFKFWFQSETAMGTTINAQTDRNSAYVKAVHECANTTF